VGASRLKWESSHVCSRLNVKKKGILKKNKTYEVTDNFILINEFLYYLGHIQIAQVPDRGEPDLQGEVNYKYIFQLLEEIGYEGFIGLEYKPRSKPNID
jgi:hypothetical protein